MKILEKARNSAMMLAFVSVLLIPVDAQAIKVKICIEFDDESGICLEYYSDDNDKDDDNDDDGDKEEDDGDSESDDS